MKERQIDDVQDLATEIANHAFEKHKLEFQDKHLGPEVKIDTKEDFEKHVVSTLESSETKCFKVEDGFEKGTCYFYNQETNTFIVVPGEKSIEPTCFRPKDFERKLDVKIEKTRDKSGNEPELKNSIYELLPELKKEAQLEHKPEKALTWYEVSQKRSALHAPAENKQRTAQPEQERQPSPKKAPAPVAAPTPSPKPAPTPQPARPLADAEPPAQKTPEESLLESLRKQEQERQEAKRQHKGRGRSPMGDLLSSHFNRKSKR